MIHNSSTVRYTPPSGFSGEDRFVFTITDANGSRANGTITVVVGTGVHAIDQQVTMSENAALPLWLEAEFGRHSETGGQACC